MHIKLFDKPVADLPQLEAEINHWLAANPKLVAIQRDIHVYHSHAAGEERTLVALWHEPKSSL
jgi:hypothetical protein